MFVTVENAQVLLRILILLVIVILVTVTAISLIHTRNVQILVVSEVYFNHLFVMLI